MQRDEMLSRLQASSEGHDSYDVIIIGGGATGLGAALDAVSRGYRTVLLEAHDFAKGTSSRSTKLIHGGVRYLQSGQVAMVRESLHERGLLLKNAPGIVQQIRFLIPAYRLGQRWYYWFGMKVYDWLAGKLGLESSRLVSRRQAEALASTLRTEKLRGGVLYSDCQFDDAGLALAIAATLAAQGGTLMNYAPVNSLLQEDGKTVGVVAQDLESGAEIQVRAKVVINATGVFGESIMSMDEVPDTKACPRIVPSVGTHLVLDAEFLPGEHAVLIPKTDDGRVLFAIPWLGKTLVGTTDHQVESVELDPQPSEKEIEYLLDHAGRYLKQQPKRSDVRSIFAGLRPLVGKVSKGKEPGEVSTASLSREHEIHVAESNLITVIGGKWTTYRKMGQDVVDLAASVAELAPASSRTSTMQLRAKHDEDQAERTSESPRLHALLPFLESQVTEAMQSQMARTVEDVLARRTRALLLDAHAASDCAPRVAEIMAQELGWSEEKKTQQIRQFREIAARYS